MKKTLLSILMAAAIPAMAQTAVSSATPATAVAPTTTISATSLLKSTAANSTANSVFIEQSGTSPTISVTQEGVGNKFGVNDRKVTLTGDSQTLTSLQRGDNNLINLEMTSTANGVSVTIQQIGNSNTVDATCGSGNSTGGTALNGCNNATINWKFSGDSNELQFRGGGTNLLSNVDVTGDSNIIRVDAVNAAHEQGIKVVGDTNTINIIQTGSLTGHAAVIDHTGPGSTYNITQTNTTANGVVSIKTQATVGGTYNITQSNQPQ